MVGSVIVAFVALLFYAMINSPAVVRKGNFKIAQYFGARDWKMMLRLTVPHFIIGTGAGLVIPFLNLYFLNRFHQESDAIGRIFSLGQLFTAVGFLIGPALAKKVGLIKTAVITQLLSIPFFLILAFSHNLALSVFAFMMRGSLMNMAWPMYNNFAMEMVSEEQQAGTNSVMSLAWNASWMVSANVGGIIIQHYGFTIVMLVTVALYVTSTAFAWALFRHKVGVGRAAGHISIPPDEVSTALSGRAE